MTYDLAIVMVVTNEVHPDCLASVARARAAASIRTCFVLVDHASDAFDAHSLARSHMPDAIVLCRDGNYGFGASCNRGAREVSARSYFFLNPDTILDDAQTLDRLAEALFSAPKIGIVAPKIAYLDGTPQRTCRRFPSWYAPFVRRTALGNRGPWRRYGAHFLMEDVDLRTRRLVDWAQGSALLVDADLFWELGGFDERYFMYYEDVDLCRSAWARGRAVVYEPSVVLRHAYGQGSAKTKGLVRSVLTNRLARAHIKSWFTYCAKWFLERV